jgi:hypothetical protein
MLRSYNDKRNVQVMFHSRQRRLQELRKTDRWRAIIGPVEAVLTAARDALIGRASNKTGRKEEFKTISIVSKCDPDGNGFF